MISDTDLRRYARQLVLPEVDEEGQAKWARAKVSLVGLGGLGAPILAYLAGAGIGHIRLIDSDHVELSNLHRQFIYAMSDIGRPKVEAAAEFATVRNDRIHIETKQAELSSDNADTLLSDCDLILDASDLLATRLTIAKTALSLKIPHLFGGAVRFDGQMGFFAPHESPQSACFGCLFDTAPEREQAPNCQQAGILGPVVGMIGLMMANTALRYLADIGTLSRNQLMLYDGLSNQFQSFSHARNPACSLCSDMRAKA